MPQRNENRIIKTPDEARGATTGQGVRYVLAIGTIATVVLFLMIYIYYFA